MHHGGVWVKGLVYCACLILGFNSILFLLPSEPELDRDTRSLVMLFHPIGSEIICCMRDRGATNFRSGNHTNAEALPRVAEILIDGLNQTGQLK